MTAECPRSGKLKGVRPFRDAQCLHFISRGAVTIRTMPGSRTYERHEAVRVTIHHGHGAAKKSHT